MSISNLECSERSYVCMRCTRVYDALSNSPFQSSKSGSYQSARSNLDSNGARTTPSNSDHASSSSTDGSSTNSSDDCRKDGAAQRAKAAEKGSLPKQKVRSVCESGSPEVLQQSKANVRKRGRPELSTATLEGWFFLYSASDERV